MTTNFSSHKIPSHMAAVQLTGHGGLDMLRYREDVPVPSPGDDEVLIKVSAAGINNTDINTRIGWYSKKVTDATDVGGAGGFDTIDEEDASSIGQVMPFPKIQGADCCGHIVAVGKNISPTRIGERVILMSVMPAESGISEHQYMTLGSEMNGAFAQYLTAPAKISFRVDCNWTDAELASIPCAYSTAENLLTRSSVKNERVLITGASGGVGSAAVQLAKVRGAYVIAVANQSKADALLHIGADRVVDRNANLVEEIGSDSVDVVVDLVGGNNWPMLLDVMVRGARYATSGAIAGPIVDLDLRSLYLKDLTLYGCTFQPVHVFENLVSYIENDKIKPLVAKTFPLSEIHAAQEEFLAKKFIGKFVLIPPK